MRGPARALADALRVLARPGLASLAGAVELAGLAALAVLLACAPAARAQTQATTLPLALPSAIVFDAQGNVYFAETDSHVVRRFSVGGAITTVAGNGVQGFAGDGGPATAAELDSPMGLAMDAAGDLYIADSHNHRVREVAAATGAIATIAGTGAAGYAGDGAAATAAKLDLPTALALDAAGNVYVADTDNHRVRRIAADTGVITTVAGDGVEGFSGDGGAATAAAIDSPNGLAVDAAGDLYIADTHNGRVRRVSAGTGAIATVAGGGVGAFGGDGGPAAAAGLALPRGLTMDAAGNLYIADSANQRVRRVSGAGVITTVAGQGTEAFAGDGASAVAASLDGPRSVVLSPAGLLTLADSGNQRIRQLDALPVPGPDIHTIAGLGNTVAGTLTLNGPSVVTYGSGAVTAALAAATIATGSVTFLDTSGQTAVTLGSVVLTAGSATLSTAGLAAGAHSIEAIYAGDATHGAAQSSALAMLVTPLAVTATASAASVLYGQAAPALSGTVSGVLAQDEGKVAVVFTTAAGAMSPVGVYPIAAVLTGSAAGNYTVSGVVGSVTVARAPTLTTLSASFGAIGPGGAVTLTMAAASTTSGVPTGSVTLLDGGAALSALPLLPSGGAAFTTSALAQGTHSLTAAYSGDANFLPSSSAAASVVVGAASDFTLTVQGAAMQAVPAGSAATYSFSVAMQDAPLASPITLAVQGAPLGAVASLNPAYVPPGGSVTSFTLTVQTPLAALDERGRPLGGGAERCGGPAVLAVLLWLPAMGLARRRAGRSGGRLAVRLVAAGVAWALVAVFASGCGNRVNTASELAGAATYTLTVSGAATGPGGTALEHSANVTLQVL